MSSDCRVILGIDPGFSTTGFGIIRCEKGRSVLLDYGALAMSSKKPIPERIALFHTFIKDKITQFGVSELALETPFLGKNPQNFLKLGYLRGILLLLTQEFDLILHEFAPRQIKLALTGHGGAAKDQVARVVIRLFPRMTMPRKEDVTDALAIMLCGLWQKKRFV